MTAKRVPKKPLIPGREAYTENGKRLAAAAQESHKNKAPALRKHKKFGVLSARHVLFIDAYLSNYCDGKKAAMAAGIAKERASAVASKWLNSDKFPQIQLEIERRLELRRNTSEVTAERIIQELSRISFFNPKRLLDHNGRIYELKDMPEDVAAVIKNINITYGQEADPETGKMITVTHTKLEFCDKMTALNQLAKMMGLDKGGSQTQVNNFFIKWDELYRHAEETAALSHAPRMIPAIGSLDGDTAADLSTVTANAALHSSPENHGRDSGPRIIPPGEYVDDIEARLEAEIRQALPRTTETLNIVSDNK